ncbi:MAG: hypothetical protein KZQ99_22460, partial [Candidatus Thiodiazotropha sp. (ex Dulcina madagascariensis)]|nr:hypothetical protein [Candidatus Thiodiazotropha sp. (ex Dulcina madagascariensis)]
AAFNDTSLSAYQRQQQLNARADKNRTAIQAETQQVADTQQADESWEVDLPERLDWRNGQSTAGAAYDPDAAVDTGWGSVLGGPDGMTFTDEMRAELNRPQYLAFINDFKVQMAEEGPQPTVADIELVRGIDGEISWDFAHLFEEEGVGELFGFPIGPMHGVPLREKLQAASDPKLSDDVSRLFAGITTDASFDDQVTAAFNMIGVRATDEQMLSVMNTIREERYTSSSAFVVDITAARLTSEVGALEARGYGYDSFERVSQLEDFNREGWLAPGGGATLVGTLAKAARSLSSDVSLWRDNLAPADMQDTARNSLVLDALTVAGPVAATKLFSAGKALMGGVSEATAVSGVTKGLPKPGSLSNEATRKWYHQQLDAISSKIDSSLPLKEQALQAFKSRNDVKMQARELMADRAAAASLPAPKTLQDVVRKAYGQGLRGDDVWRYLLGGSQRSNAGVDAALGLKR